MVERGLRSTCNVLSSQSDSGSLHILSAILAPLQFLAAKELADMNFICGLHQLESTQPTLAIFSWSRLHFRRRV